MENLVLIYFKWNPEGPNSHILPHNMYYNYYYPKPKYLTIGYLDPLENSSFHYMPAGCNFRVERPAATRMPCGVEELHEAQK